MFLEFKADIQQSQFDILNILLKVNYTECNPVLERFVYEDERNYERVGLKVNFEGSGVVERELNDRISGFLWGVMALQHLK